MDLPPLQREHLRVADHARQEAEKDLASLKQPGRSLAFTVILLLLASYLAGGKKSSSK